MFNDRIFTLFIDNEIFITSDGEVWYNINQPIFGFQLEFQGINITSISGGDAENNNFQLSFSNEDSEFNDFSSKGSFLL